MCMDIKKRAFYPHQICSPLLFFLYFLFLLLYSSSKHASFAPSLLGQAQYCTSKIMIEKVFLNRKILHFFFQFSILESSSQLLITVGELVFKSM